MTTIILLALLLRFPFITQSLWLDEAIEALALMGRQGPLLSYALADYQPPLYHFLAYPLTHLLGYSELVLRLPSLISGILVVYFGMKIAKLLGSSKLVATVGLLLATNPLLIYYSQEGRTYILTTALSTISFYYLAQLLDKSESKTAVRFWYTLSSTLMVWTSYLSWYLLLAEFIYALYKKRRDVAVLTLISASTLILWLPSFIGSLHVGTYTLGLSAAWGRVVGGLSLKSLPLTWVKFNLGRISFASRYLYAILVLLVFALHTYILKKLTWDRAKLLLIWLIVPIICGMGTAIFLPVYSYFRVLFVLPAYLILLALALDKLPQIYTHLVISLNLIFLLIFWFSPTLHREDWRSFTRDLNTDPSAQVAMPSHEQNPGLLYYGLDEARIFEPKKQDPYTHRVYYVRYAEDLFDGERSGPANLSRSGYTMTSQKVYPGIQVDIYENSR